MSTILIDGRALTDRATAHTYLQQVLDLPKHYGRNLDALYDCLMEKTECRIMITYVEVLKEALGRYGEGILAAFEEAAGQNPKISVILEGISEVVVEEDKKV